MKRSILKYVIQGIVNVNGKWVEQDVSEEFLTKKLANAALRKNQYKTCINPRIVSRWVPDDLYNK